MSFTKKTLYEWARDRFKGDQFQTFQDFCERDFDKEPTNEVSEQVFNGYVNEFKRSIRVN